MQLKALIFDVDGTLAETEELHRQAFNETFAELNLMREWPDHTHHWHWSVETYARLLKTTGGKERIAHYLSGDLGLDVRPTSPRIAEIHRQKTQRFERLVTTGALPLRRGIARIMQIGREKGLAIAVATTTSHANVQALCRACFGQSMEDVFDVVAAGDDVPRKKPAPDIYVLAQQRLGIESRACLAFEDSRNGLLAAKAAGLRCIVCPSLYAAGEDHTEADLVVSHFEDAIWLLDQPC
jgi:HAD superfamily hydrolase (TIGR01509 family)